MSEKRFHAATFRALVVAALLPFLTNGLFAQTAFPELGAGGGRPHELRNPRIEFAGSTEKGGVFRVLAKFSLRPGEKLYAEEIVFTWPRLDGLKLRQIGIPEGENYDDPYLKRTFMVYTKDAVVWTDFTVTADTIDEIGGAGTLAFRGCNEETCFQEQTVTIRFGADDLRDPLAPLTEKAGVAPVAASAGNDAAPGPATENFLIGLLQAFGVGFLIALTPCVYPMIPITAAIVGGAGGRGATKTAAVFGSLAYVFGLSITYALLGTLAVYFGAAFRLFLRSGWVLFPLAGIFFLLGLAMFDIVTVQMPAALQSRLAGKKTGHGIGGIFFRGMLMGLVATPCVAAPLAGMLTYIAATASYATGFFSLMALAWGMGVPLIVVGCASASVLPAAGAWMEKIKYVFGFALLWAGVYVLLPLLGAGVFKLATGALLVGGAVFLGLLDATDADSPKSKRFGKAVGILIVVYGAITFGEGLDLVRDVGSGRPADFAASPELTPTELDAAIDASFKSDRPTLLFFTAVNCTYCEKIKREILPNERVRTALVGIDLLIVDLDRHGKVAARFGISTPPTLLFYDRQGDRREDLTLHNTDVETFIAHLDGIR